MADKKRGKRHCCYGRCKSDERYPEKNEEVVFFPFPKPKTRLEECKIWIKACGRPHEQLNPEAITKNFFVCSKHFVDGRPTEMYPYPIPYDGQPVRRGRKCRNSERHNETSCRQATGSAASLTVKSVPVECDNSAAPWTDTTENPLDLLSTAAEMRRLQAENPLDLLSTAAEMRRLQAENPLDLLSTAAEMRTLQEENSMLGRRVEHLEAENSMLGRKVQHLEAENSMLGRKVQHLEAEAEERQKPGVNHSTQTQTYTCTCTSDMTDKVTKSKIKTLFQCYTGLTLIAFSSLLSLLVPDENQNPIKYPRKRKDIQKLSIRDQLLLVLMRLRCGLSVTDLAFRFSVSRQSVSELFSSWIGYMFCQLGFFCWWPHRDVIIKHMPSGFKKNFPRSLAIIDCTELKTETPSSLTVQSMCYSDYKSSPTLKSLVAVDPMGSVMYVSPLFSGSISDNDICLQSGFYDYLSTKIANGDLAVGDAIMADKGFTIEKELSKLGLQLNIPPFASSTTQMSASDVAYTNLIAAHRIHVERRIGKIKNFKLVSHKIPITLFPMINEIWFVCCFLSNFQTNILKSD